MVIHLNKFNSLEPKDALCPVWLNCPGSSRSGKDKNVKYYDDNDDKQLPLLTLFAVFSFDQ